MASIHTVSGSHSLRARFPEPQQQRTTNAELSNNKPAENQLHTPTYSTKTYSGTNYGTGKLRANVKEITKPSDSE